LQHNPEQSDLPPLPPNFLEKLSTLTQAFSDEDLNRLPTPEPNCHCIYCQVINAIRGNTIEEEVSEEDLRFRNWDVKSTTTDKLYLVTNPLDENEYYRVFLGEPLGCTCGQKNCEHIHAVLNT
jgi:hypothetical protein